MWRRKAAIAAALILSAAYLAWFRMTGIGIPCIFRAVTGFKCPGCGITTMLAALLFFDFRESYRANPFLFVTMPFIVLECVLEYDRRRKNEWQSRINRILLYCYIGFLLLFGVIRNLSPGL